MTALVSFARALADPTRFRLIRLMKNEALCVCELADILQMPPSTVSSHLQIIRKAGILEHERCEKWIYYRVTRASRSLIDTLETSFSTSTDPTLKKDARRMIARLHQRAGSCCPGPQKLASLSPSLATLS